MTISKWHFYVHATLLILHMYVVLWPHVSLCFQGKTMLYFFCTSMLLSQLLLQNTRKGQNTITTLKEMSQGLAYLGEVFLFHTRLAGMPQLFAKLEGMCPSLTHLDETFLFLTQVQPLSLQGKKVSPSPFNPSNTGYTYVHTTYSVYWRQEWVWSVMYQCVCTTVVMSTSMYVCSSMLSCAHALTCWWTYIMCFSHCV